MKRALEETLTWCLARLDEGASIEDCLRGQGPLTEELRPLLEAAQGLRGQGGRIPPHTPQAFREGRARMHAARVREAEEGGRAPWAGFLLSRPVRLAAVAVVVAVLAALGLTTGLFRFNADTTVADVQGVASRVDPDVIVLETADGDLIIRIGENTVVLDAAGNVISGGDIVPGKPVRVEIEEDGALTAQRIEVEEDDERGNGTEVEFSGVIKTVSGSVITVQASFGAATVRVDSQTEVKGPLVQGAAAEVHATLQGDGSYLAREIDVKEVDSGDVGDHGDDGDDSDGDDSSGNGSGDDHRGDDDGDDGGNDGHYEREAE